MKAKELQSAIKDICKITSEALPIRIWGVGGAMYIAVTQRDSILEFTFPNKSTYFDTQILLSELKRRVGACKPDDTIRFDWEHANLVLRCEASTDSYVFTTHNIDPDVKTIDVIYSMPIPLLDMIKKMNKVDIRYGLDRHHPMNYMHLTKSHLEIATRRMFWRTPILTRNLPKDEYLVPSIPYWITNLNSGTIGTDASGESWVCWYFKSGSAKFYEKMGNESITKIKYPDLNNMIPKTVKTMFRLSAPALLLEKLTVPPILDPVKPEDAGGTIHFKVDKNNIISVRLTAPDSSDKVGKEIGNGFPALEVQMPVNSEIAFTASSVAYAFRLGYTTVKVADTNTPAIFTNGAGMIVRMPVKIA